VRILIFAAYYLPHIGGYTLGTHEVAKGLVERGHEVDVLTCNTTKQSEYEIIDGVVVYRLPCWNILGGQYPIPKPSISAVIVGMQVLFKHYDIVNTQTRFFIMSFFGAVFAKLKRIPCMHTERGASHSIASGKITDILGRICDHTMGALTVRMATVRVGVSWVSCDFMKHLGGKDAVMIPNGVYDLFFNHMVNGSGSDTIVFAGRLVYGKGVQDLIYAFGDIRSRIPMAKLLIVGDGCYRDKLERQMGKNGGIEFAGEKSPKELAETLASCAVFVHPSYSEGMPSAVSEASAVGLPVVATDAGGTREVIEDGCTGYLVGIGEIGDMASKVVKLLCNQLLSKAMGNAGRAKMNQGFRWPAIIDRYEELFKSITNH